MRFGAACSACATGLYPAVSDQISNESAGGLELFPGVGLERINQVLA